MNILEAIKQTRHVFESVPEAKEILDYLEQVIIGDCIAPDANVERNRELLLKRSVVGVVKYGTTTERTDLTFAQWADHAIEEALDMANYLQAAKNAHAGNGMFIPLRKPDEKDLTVVTDFVERRGIAGRTISVVDHESDEGAPWCKPDDVL